MSAMSGWTRPTRISKKAVPPPRSRKSPIRSATARCPIFHAPTSCASAILRPGPDPDYLRRSFVPPDHGQGGLHDAEPGLEQFVLNAWCIRRVNLQPFDTPENTRLART